VRLRKAGRGSPKAKQNKKGWGQERKDTGKETLRGVSTPLGGGG